MQVGVNILNFGPGVRPDMLLRWAQVSESLGYHSLMISDHIAITPSVSERYPEPFYDCFTTLGWLAGQTSQIRLGTTVVVLPYRHPILTARLVANLDQLSGGRFIFGVGVGNPQDEYRVLGVDHSRRGAIADEDLRIMKAVWNAGLPVTLECRYAHIEDVAGIPTHQQPHPPIWVGGGSEAALRRTVRYGQAWHPILRTLDKVESDLAKLRELAATQGRPVPAFCPRIRFDLHESAVEGDRWPGAGSLEQVRGDLLRLQEYGATHVTLDWYTGDLEKTRDHKRGLDMLQTIAESVLDLKTESLR